MEFWVYVLTAVACFLPHAFAKESYNLNNIIPPQFDDPDGPLLDYLENTNASRVTLNGTVEHADLEWLDFEVEDLFDPAFRLKHGLPDPRYYRNDTGEDRKKVHRRFLWIPSDMHREHRATKSVPPRVHKPKKGKHYDVNLMNFTTTYERMPAAHQCWNGQDERAAMNGNLGGAFVCRDYLILAHRRGRCSGYDRYPRDMWCDVEYEGVRTTVRAFSAPYVKEYGRIHKFGPKILSGGCDRAAEGLEWLLRTCPFATGCLHRKCPIGGVTSLANEDQIIMLLMNY
ncbi:hypothetical protein B0T10DRAFT_550598 [Thelonectria olida]|uniref:Uncharacterized protein n=1 Tax=Thelonectria olida TaxID=1576542 RepID=A0A9P8VYP0_9HYPO|nr:hypothetical protein B0T10DRAFT_550598 [Thelonectria olida]